MATSSASAVPVRHRFRHKVKRWTHTKIYERRFATGREYVHAYLRAGKDLSVPTEKLIKHALPPGTVGEKSHVIFSNFIHLGMSLDEGEPVTRSHVHHALAYQGLTHLEPWVALEMGLDLAHRRELMAERMFYPIMEPLIRPDDKFEGLLSQHVSFYLRTSPSDTSLDVHPHTNGRLGSDDVFLEKNTVFAAGLHRMAG